MNYILVENRTTLLLGPMVWKPRFIQSELDDLEISFTVSPAEPNGYLKITDALEIFPVVSSTGAGHDTVFETIAGPYFTYNPDNTAVETYNVLPLPLDAVKANLKNIVAFERYRREELGTTITFAAGDIPLATDRANRGQYATLLQSMGTGTISFKVGTSFLPLNTANVTEMVQAVHDYVQAQFAWEQDIHGQIDAAPDVATLKAIPILPAPPKPPVLGA